MDEEFLATTYPKVTTSTIPQKATSITTLLPEITPFHHPSVRVANWRIDMSKVMKTDHSADTLVILNFQVPMLLTVSRTKLGFIKNLESKMVEKRLSKSKEEQVLSINLHAKENLTATENPANYHLYHPLMEAFNSSMNDCLDKEVPSAGLNRVKVDKGEDTIQVLLEDERPATPEPGMTHSPNDFPECDNWANAYATTYELERRSSAKADFGRSSFILVKKPFTRSSLFLQFQWMNAISLPTNKVDFGDKELGKTALSISKAQSSRLHRLWTRELVPSLWVESERDYDISAAYGITHWWFGRKQFYINKHSEPSDREAIRSQMRILSVICVKTFEKYGYNYLREIILHRADYKEYKILEKDFNNLHPNDFEDLYLLNIQDKPNHLSKSDKIHLHTAVNMWIRNLVIQELCVETCSIGIESYQTSSTSNANWDATDYSYKKIIRFIPKPTKPFLQDLNDQRKLTEAE
ncbi:hypothetical protein Tco_0189169 [Tanacetum coccineum]